MYSCDLEVYAMKKSQACKKYKNCSNFVHLLFYTDIQLENISLINLLKRQFYSLVDLDEAMYSNLLKMQQLYAI